ncbi:MAG: cyclic pyranopterin monophosphate synthase MoaC [Dictyoglomaceae bacterium]
MGDIKMIDISEKEPTERYARAEGKIYVSEEVFDRIVNNNIEKGDVLTSAKIAGIMAGKSTFQLIPLCHPIELTKIDIEIIPLREEGALKVIVDAKTLGRTGVEMEALTAVAVSLLTIYDFCKMYDPNMIISDIKLLAKSGGKSGEWKRKT